jgi:hypothetical protein
VPPIAAEGQSHSPILKLRPWPNVRRFEPVIGDVRQQAPACCPRSWRLNLHVRCHAPIGLRAEFLLLKCRGHSQEGMGAASPGPPSVHWFPRFSAVFVSLVRTADLAGMKVGPGIDPDAIGALRTPQAPRLSVRGTQGPKAVRVVPCIGAGVRLNGARRPVLRRMLHWEVVFTEPQDAPALGVSQDLAGWCVAEPEEILKESSGRLDKPSGVMPGQSVPRVHVYRSRSPSNTIRFATCHRGANTRRSRRPVSELVNCSTRSKRVSRAPVAALTPS